ncbi:hypothetical protein Tco_0493025, partial [Tanacetum coccineum]
MQQLCGASEYSMIVSKVPNTEDMIKFMLDTEEFTYTEDMFRVSLHLPVETLENLFVSSVNIQTIEGFMNRVGYQGVVDKKKEAIQYPRLIKLIIVDLMKKFPNIPQRIDEDYHSIKDDIPLVSMYTTGNVLVQGMLIPNEFPTEEICATDDFKEYETVFVRVDVPMNQPQLVVSTQVTHRPTPRAHRIPTVSTASPQGKKRKQIVGESSSPHKSLEPGSHKENTEHVDVDDDEERVDEKKDDEMGSLETRTEEMQTSIPTTPRSLRTILSSDKNITQELMDTTLIQNMERKCITTKYFWKTHKKVHQVLHEIVPQITERATYDLIENNLKPSITATIIEDRDAFHSQVPDLVSQEFNAQAPKIIEELFKNYLQKVFKIKLMIQYCGRHDEHQEDDAPPKGDKRVKRHKASKSSKSARGSSSKHSAKDSTTYVVSLQILSRTRKNLERQLDKETLHETDSNSDLRVIKVQFDQFIHSKVLEPSNYNSYNLETRQDFKHYTQMEPQTFKEAIIQNIDSIEQCIVERSCHEQELQNRLKSSRIVFDKGNDQSLENHSNTSGDEISRSRNECNDKSIYGDDTDIRPPYDTEPMVEVPYTVEYNVFAVDTQHYEQPECIINTCVGEKVD